MAWITPKTNWAKDDYFNASDYNRIKGNADFLYGMKKGSSTATDYPNSLVVYNLEQTGSGAVGIPEAEIDERYSVRTHTPIKNGRGYFSLKVVLRDGQTVFVEFDSKKDGVLRMEEMSFPTAVTWVVRSIQTQLYADYFDIADTGSEKIVNELLYAREVNTVLDNLELIGSNMGLPFDERPYYSADGSMPDAEELNLIEEYELLLYNRINARPYAIYLGDGYVGNRYSNIRM